MFMQNEKGYLHVYQRLFCLRTWRIHAAGLPSCWSCRPTTNVSPNAARGEDESGGGWVLGTGFRPRTNHLRNRFPTGQQPVRNDGLDGKEEGLDSILFYPANSAGHSGVCLFYVSFGLLGAILTEVIMTLCAYSCSAGGGEEDGFCSIQNKQSQ